MILGEEPIGGQIKKWRTNLGLTMAQASRIADMPATVWSRIEDGRTLNPYMSTVVKMLTALGAQVHVTAAPKEHQWVDTQK